MVSPKPKSAPWFVPFKSSEKLGVTEVSAWSPEDQGSRHWVREGLEAFERQLAQGPKSTYCFGDTPTMADCCLVPQIFNGKRFDVNFEGLPLTMGAFDACMKLDAFQKAHPSACPDAE